MFNTKNENSFICQYIKPRMTCSHLIITSFIYGFISAFISGKLLSLIISTIIIELIIIALENKFVGEIDYIYRYILAIISLSGWLLCRIIFFDLQIK